MHERLFSIAFILTLIALTRLEKLRFGSILTPFTVTAWPFIGIMILNNFFLDKLGFSLITMKSQAFILFNLMLIWFVGYIMSYVFNFSIRTTQGNLDEVFSPFAKYQGLLILLSWIAIIITVHKVFTLVQANGSVDYIAEKEFEDSMVKGVAAHFIHVGTICFILLVFTINKVSNKFLSVFTLIGLFIALILIQVKYHLIWVILISFFYFNHSKNIKSQLISILKIGVVILLTMNLFWVLLLTIWGSIGTSTGWDFLVKHSFDYFVSGPIVLDIWLNLGNSRPDWTLLTVPLNLIYLVLGNPLRIDPTPLVSGAFFEVAPGVISNVGTSFGVYYIIGGFPLTIFMTILVSIFSYYFYYKNLLHANIYNIFLNYLFLTLGVLSFFGQYFTALTFYETIILYLFLIIIFKIIGSVQLLVKTHYENKIKT